MPSGQGAPAQALGGDRPPLTAPGLTGLSDLCCFGLFGEKAAGGLRGAFWEAQVLAPPLAQLGPGRLLT